MKYTSGPWQIHGNSVVGVDETQDDGEIQCQRIATLAPCQESSANARLIAAAPDLLDALRRIAMASEFDVARGIQCAKEMRQIARAAISKARGEQN